MSAIKQGEITVKNIFYTDRGEHLSYSFGTFTNTRTKKLTNLKTKNKMKTETKQKWDAIIKLAIAILSAIAGAIGASACSAL